ncbi:TPA: hypothetical protein MNM85_000180 [Citrobacter freundii]|nr:hypothetical protein [Citrobacter freundii]EKY1458224.1 hypothetical protein [Citrobacter freundii]RDU16183.1 hypothetical protein DWV02_21365 [Citrobacter freundii]HBZ8959709.1 hypothetical protein [Citrobacter freundii]HBZ9018879.1 hypothetical protein [Citrobacter freundii]HCA0562385.1 hypothetical protein [Citrobacter freundii]
MTIAERLKQEGHHNGLQQGLQQGLEQGVQKGTQEEALRIARMMLENGIDRDLVNYWATARRCHRMSQIGKVCNLPC